MNPNTEQQNQSIQEPRADTRKFSPTSVFLMVGTALIYDGMGLLLNLTVVGSIITPVINVLAFCTFYLWFKLKGVKFNKLSNVSVMGGTSIIEFVPFLNALPVWTGAVLWFVYKDKILKKIPGSKTTSSFVSRK